MKLKPASGRAVRDPVKGKLLPESGATVTLNAFWRRRLRDGDVVEVTDAETSAATTTESTATTTESTATTATATDSAATTTTSDTADSTEATS